jgi:hypothetical protein
MHKLLFSIQPGLDLVSSQIQCNENRMPMTKAHTNDRQKHTQTTDEMHTQTTDEMHTQTTDEMHTQTTEVRYDFD